MKRATGLCASAAMLVLAAQPCLAAEDIRNQVDMERRSAMFAGATMRLPLGPAAAHRPSVRLQLTARYTNESHAAAPTIVAQPAGFEFGATRSGAPSFYIGGLSLRQFQRRISAAQDDDGQSDSDRNLTGAMILGGLVIAGIIGAIALNDQTDPEDVTTSPPSD